MAERGGVGQVLRDLLRYEEILGAVALNREGLVVGSAGVAREDAEMAGALGASLVGATDRTARRLGAGAVKVTTIATTDGMIHVQSGEDFALLLFTDHCNTLDLATVCESALGQLGGLLSPA